MNRVVTPLAGLLIVLGLSRAPAADEKIKESPYYPLKIGTKWHYRVGANSFVMHVAKHEKVDGTVCALLETSRDGQVLTNEQIGIKDDGIYRFSIAGQKPDNPFRILKLPAKKGDTWKVESKIGAQSFKGSFTVGEAEVTVPAGKYKAITAASDGFEIPDDNGNFLKITFNFWFVEKVGLVKQTIKIADKPEVVIELEKYEAP